MQLSMDLAQEGMLMFFKPYQVDALKALWEKGSMNSRQIWDAVGSDKISRASIINFLNAAVENGLLEVTFATSKGGHRGIYKPKFDEAETKEYIRKIFQERLQSL